jgi:hypothetical protein
MDTRFLFAALAVLFSVFVVFAGFTSYRHISDRPALTISQVH